MNIETAIQSPMFDGLSKRSISGFVRFCSLNPHVYEAFRHFAVELYESGTRRYSAKGIVERMRWEMQLQTRGDRFRLSNNYTPHLARVLMLEDERFTKFFSRRTHSLAIA